MNPYHETEAFGLHTRGGSADVGLLAAHVRARLHGALGVISLRQVYRNLTTEHVECIYTFPLAWQSVLLGMQVSLNGQRMQGVVKPKRQAEADYEAALADGHLPVLLERAGKDLYSASIGNL